MYPLFPLVCLVSTLCCALRLYSILELRTRTDTCLWFAHGMSVFGGLVSMQKKLVVLLVWFRFLITSDPTFCCVQVVEVTDSAHIAPSATAVEQSQILR